MSGTIAGSGGGLSYSSEEPTAEMVNQGSIATCVVACVRQLLLDAGVEFSEADLTERIGLLDESGSTGESAARILTELHPRLVYLGGSLPLEQLSLFFRRDPWIAFLRTDSGRVHSVIVDNCAGKVVHVRDPWGLSGPGSNRGSRGTLELDAFEIRWRATFCNGIVPNRLK